ncbi:unnamed protein product, partial [Staurois parvus]
MNLVNVTFCHLKFPADPSPVHPDTHRGRNPDDRCRHPREDITGDTAGGTSQGSAGQGKRRTDPGAAPHGKPECSSGLPLVVLK